MKTRFLLIALLVLAVLLPWLNNDKDPAKPEQSVIHTFLSESEKDFKKVYSPRPFVFPEDHGPHERYRTEWWYFTGNVADKSGRRFGYQLTFFRLALAPKPLQSKSSWRTGQIYMAHFALTDVLENKFYTHERFSRAGNGLAGASKQRLHVWLYDWSATAANEQNTQLQIQAKNENIAIDLDLKALKPMVLQGDRGYFRKNPEPGNASYYYSFTRMATQGVIQIDGRSHAVSGFSWMDREWSSRSLAEQQIGWDWFALQLSDQSELMVYHFRREDGQRDTFSSGMIMQPDHSRLVLDYQDVNIKVLNQWLSPLGVNYPSKWQISIPKLKMKLEIKPLIQNQELDTGFRYWEGAVKVTGSKQGQPVSGYGYVELTGYQAATLK